MHPTFFSCRFTSRFSSSCALALCLAGCSSSSGPGYTGGSTGSGATGSSGAASGAQSGAATGASTGAGSTGASSGATSGDTAGTSSGGPSGSTGNATSGATTGSATGSDTSQAWNHPSPATSAAQFPFPQNRTGSHCTFPSTPSVATLNSQLSKTYSSWKIEYVTSTGAPAGGQRVVDPQGDPGNGGPANRTVSEGIGYGMLLAVYMNDKPLFDSLWVYAQAHMRNGLMSWEIDANGSPVGNGGANSATDADEDMGWALLMADKQWGGSYLTTGNSLVGNMRSQEVNSQNTLSDGNFGGNGSHPDYASPAYYKEFGSNWSSVTQAEYGLLTSTQNKTTGLIPDSTGGSSFGYDACRAPWRVGLDYCFNGSSSAQAFLAPMVAFFVTQGAPNLKLPIPTGGGTGSYASGAISGPAGVSAMINASNQAFIDASWQQTYAKTTAETAGASNYFGSTVGVLSLLVMSGNFFDYRNPPAAP